MSEFMEKPACETTLCKFRHLPEKHGLTERIFKSFKDFLIGKNIILHEGTMVDAIIIETSQSTKNKTHQRTSEMGGTKKNNAYHYGVKAHIGMDKDSKIVHSITITRADVNDIEESGNLVHGEESVIYGDAGYTGMEYRTSICEKFQDGSGEIEWTQRSHKKLSYMICKKRKDINFEINRKRKTLTTLEEREHEMQKTSVRIHVEHIFAVIKERFGCRKIVYRSMQKAKTKLLMLFALANLLTYARMKLSTK